nr:hypothetical protein [Eubacterium sp.]
NSGYYKYLKIENTKTRKLVVDKCWFDIDNRVFRVDAWSRLDKYCYGITDKYGEYVALEREKIGIKEIFYIVMKPGTYFVDLYSVKNDILDGSVGLRRYKFYDYDKYVEQYYGGGSSSYSNEWVNGKWYDANGKQTYKGTLSWKSDASGWWVEDSEGWYPTSQWQKIDGKWYYFLSNGYMDYSEYREGCWLNADGSMADGYTGGHWCSDGYGWWYEDNGWYPKNQYLWIDGTQYWFGASGYWE